MKPKISGIVHNCALNVALPTLLADIKHFAELEAKSGMRQVDDSVYKNHQILRKQFEKAHGLKTDLTWVAFQRLIESYHNNFFLLQQMFALPLRLFIKEKGATKSDYELQENGRFNDLSPHVLKEQYYQPFKINVYVYDTKSIDMAIAAGEEIPPDALLCDPENSGRVDLNIYSDPNLPCHATHFELVDLRIVDKEQFFEQEFMEREALPTLIAGLQCSNFDCSKQLTLRQFSLIAKDLQKNALAQEEELETSSSQAVGEDPQDPYEKNTSYQQYVKNLLGMYNNGFFNLNQDKSIDLDNIGEVKVKTDDKGNVIETNKEFAKRLQEAEIRRSFQK